MNKKKLGMTIGSLALVGAIAVGGTLAYLTDQTDNVKNTFTIDSNLDITLNELSVNHNSRTDANEYEDVIPNVPLFKDPTVTINNTDIDQYVFMAVQTSNDVIINEIDKSWTEYTSDGALDSNIKVYYQVYENGTTSDAYLNNATANIDGEDVDLKYAENSFQLKALFNYVTPSDKTYPEGGAAPTYQPILIRAATIQKDGVDDVDDAYKAIKTGLIAFNENN